MTFDAWLLRIHLTLIALGFLSLVAAVLCAAMYLAQSWQLKSKHIGSMFLRLPSLAALDRAHFITLGWGVMLFSAGILGGFFSAKNRVELAAVLKDPKVTLSLTACLIYWVILSLRLLELKRGQKIAVGTLLTFALLFAVMGGMHHSALDFHKGY